MKASKLHPLLIHIYQWGNPPSSKRTPYPILYDELDLNPAACDQAFPVESYDTFAANS